MTSVPEGFVVRRDDDTRVYDGVLVGGSPRRALRLNAAAMRAWAELVSGPARSTGARKLARRLLDAGLVHPDTTPATPEAGVVTIVVPVRDRPDELDHCLAALRRHTDEAGIIVVDDASHDAGRTALISARHGARVIRLDVNRGPAGARNAGLRAATTPLVAFVDSDCTVGAGWLAALLPHFDDPQVAAVAPRITGDHAESGGLVERFTREASPLDLGPRPANVTAQGGVSYVPSAALLLRTGLTTFDETLRYGEDVDLVWRLRDAGWSVRYEPTVRVAHREPARIGAWARRRYDYGTSAAALDRRHPGRLAPAIFRPLALTAAILALAARPAPAALAASLSYALYRRQLVEQQLPTDHALRDSARGVAQSVRGVTCWLQQFAPAAIPFLVAYAARRPGGRYAALAAWALPPCLDLWERDREASAPRVGAPVYLAMRALDRAAYGAGVILGAARLRRPAVVLPQVVLSTRVRRWLAKARR